MSRKTSKLQVAVLTLRRRALFDAFRCHVNVVFTQGDGVEDLFCTNFDLRMKDKVALLYSSLDSMCEQFNTEYNNGLMDGFNAQPHPQVTRFQHTPSALFLGGPVQGKRRPSNPWFRKPVRSKLLKL